MFRFENIEHLYALALLLPLGALLYFGRRWYLAQQTRIGDADLIYQQADVVSERRYRLTSILALVTAASLIFAWANPQWGAKRQKVKARSSDIFLALDISTSMYCQDIAPNRLEQAKRFAIDLVEELKGERIGLILFAGSAYLQMPLTTDYAAAELFVRSASPALAGTQGTALEDVLQTAKENFTAEDKFQKTLIIISDGEDHDAESISLAEAMGDEGVTIFTVGVGTGEGGFIPIRVNGQTDWKRGEDGKPVETRLNETLLQALAEQANGQYFRVEGGKDVFATIKNRVDQMEKQEFEERSFTEYESYYQYFLFFGCLSLLLLWMIQHDFIVNVRS